MICRHNLYHFTVANTRFTAPLTRRGKTKFATIKWYNLCRQIIQSQTCYPLNDLSFCAIDIFFSFQTPTWRSHLTNLTWVSTKAHAAVNKWITHVIRILRVLLKQCMSPTSANKFNSAVEICQTCRTIGHFLWMSDKKKMLECRTKCPTENIKTSLWWMKRSETQALMAL